MWAFIFFVCLTGSLATVSEEIVWLVNPAARSNAPVPSATKLGFDEILKQIKQQEGTTIVSFLAVPVKDQYALQVFASRPNGGEPILYVNPYTGKIQGEKSIFDIRQFLAALHGWLLIPFTARYSLGWYLVSAMSIPLLGSLITGLVVYKKFWRAFFRPRLRFGNGARIFWGDFHRLAGLWSIPFIAIISVTALWFLARAAIEDSGYHFPAEIEEPHIARSNIPIGATREAINGISVDRAIEIARGKFPGLNPAFIGFPSDAYHPIRIWGRGAYPLVFQTAHIDPYSGTVLQTRGIPDYGIPELVTDSMRPLHTGDFAGLWLKLVYLFFGLLLTLMSLSGMLIWTKRTALATAKLIKVGKASALGGSPSPALREGGALSKFAIGPTWRRWRFHLAALLILLPFFLLKPYLDLQVKTSIGADDGLRSVPVSVGPWAMQLQEPRDQTPVWHPGEGYQKSFKIAPCMACVPRIRAMFIRIGKSGGTWDKSAHFEGNPYRQTADVPITKEANLDDLILIKAEAWDGSQYEATLPIIEASPATAQWLKSAR